MKLGTVVEVDVDLGDLKGKNGVGYYQNTLYETFEDSIKILSFSSSKDFSGEYVLEKNDSSCT